MNSVYLFITFVIVFIPVAILQIAMPILTRRTESFGVSIPTDQFKNPDIIQMRKKYMLVTVILSIITLIIMAVTSRFELVFPILLIAYLVVSFFIYLSFHNRMKAYKTEQNWNAERKQKVVIDTSFRSKKLTHSNAWFGIGLLITLATITITVVMYDKIPAKIPMHSDMAGHVDRWADKSYRSLMLLPVIQFYMLGLFVFINAMIGRAKALIDPDAPEASIQKNVIFRRRWSAFMIAIGTAMIVMMGLGQMTFIFDINPTVVNAVNLVIIALVIVGSLILSFTTGQGGSRVTRVGKQDSTVINRDDDKYWKLGIFYFNPQDPALFIEKRFGVGWTNNFAHPLSWIILIGIIVIIVLITVIFK